MPENKLILKLTEEQRKQIKDATGKSVSQLTIGLSAAGGELAEQSLDKVVGGMRKAGGDPTSAGSPFLQFTFE